MPCHHMTAVVINGLMISSLVAISKHCIALPSKYNNLVFTCDS